MALWYSDNFDWRALRAKLLQTEWLFCVLVCVLWHKNLSIVLMNSTLQNVFNEYNSYLNFQRTIAPGSKYLANIKIASISTKFENM